MESTVYAVKFFFFNCAHFHHTSHFEIGFMTEPAEQCHSRAKSSELDRVPITLEHNKVFSNTNNTSLCYYLSLRVYNIFNNYR